MRATCCVEPSMNSSPASSYAFDSSSSTRSASRAVISPMRYVSIFTPASSIDASTAVSGSSMRSYNSSLPRAQQRGEPARHLGGTDERGRLLLRLRVRQRLDAVLGRENVELVHGASR